MTSEKIGKDVDNSVGEKTIPISTTLYIIIISSLSLLE